MHIRVILQNSPDLWYYVTVTSLTGRSGFHSSSSTGEMSVPSIPVYEKIAAYCYSDVKMLRDYLDLRID